MGVLAAPASRRTAKLPGEPPGPWTRLLGHGHSAGLGFAEAWLASGRCQLQNAAAPGSKGYSGIILLRVGHARRGTSAGLSATIGALQTRGKLTRDLRPPCVLLVRSQPDAGCRRGPRPLVRGPYQNRHMPAGEVGALERRSAAAQRRPTQLQSRVPRTGSPWHRGVEFCPSRHRRDFVSTEEMMGPGKTHKQREQGTTLRPATPFL